MLRLRAVCLLLSLTLSQHIRAATPLHADYYQEMALRSSRELFFQALPQWALVVNLVAATILYFVWRSQRNIPQVSYLVGACLVGNVTNLSSLYPEWLNPLFADTLLSTWLYCLARLLFSQPSATQQRWLGACAALLLITFGFARERGGTSAHAAALSVAFLALSTTAALGLYKLTVPSQRPKLSLLLGVLLLGLSGLLDNLSSVLNWTLAQHILLSPFAQIIFVILVLYYMVSRHASNQLLLTHLNATLDIRLHEAERELEDRYRLATQDAVEAATVRERRNIYHSIHEDLSDKLLQLIYRAPTPETADLARAALAELRDTQRLHPEEHRVVPHILADALAEVQSRCEQVNLRLIWQVAPQLESYTLNARQESALTRTLREAVSNLFKHARASEVEICFRLSDGLPRSLHYSVSDNGVGIDSTRPRGRGLINMRQRLEELGGEISIGSTSHGGTSLLFSLPFTSELSK